MRKIVSTSPRKYVETVRSQAGIELKLIDILAARGYDFPKGKTLSQILVESRQAYEIVISAGCAKLVTRLISYHEERAKAVRNGITPANELAKLPRGYTRPGKKSRTSLLQIAMPIPSDWREEWTQLQQALHCAWR